MSQPLFGLVGDIGGTNCRFALVDAAGGEVREPRRYPNRDFDSPEAAIETYLAEMGLTRRPSGCVIAVAGPVTDGTIDFTNSDWVLSECGLVELGFERARLINDFAAQALGAPSIGPDGRLLIGSAVEGERGAPLVVMGPGTGFGVGGLVPVGRGEVGIATEGGHAAFAPTDELEVEIWRWFVRLYGRVSVERILSGQGLFDLYRALAEIRGEPAPLADQKAVQAASVQGDPLAVLTVDRFCAILGSAAGDIALGLGARRGVYVTGGVAQRLADPIASGPFRERFEDKGRFQDYMRAIPTFLITEAYTALRGCAAFLSALEA